MPATCIIERVLRTAEVERTWTPDIGQRPPLAKVAAKAAPDSHVTSVDRH